MTKLSDTQLILLASAAVRDDGATSRPPKMTKAVATKAAAVLIDRKLMREVAAKTGMLAWRDDEDSRPMALVITAKGRKAIGVEGTDQGIAGPSQDRPSTSGTAMVTKATQSRGQREPKPVASDGSQTNQISRASETAIDRATIRVDGALASMTDRPPREGSKAALVIKMLRGGSGATLDTLVEATGWLPHTTRAALTGLRKRGFEIMRSADAGAVSTYRIAAHAADAPAAADVASAALRAPEGVIAASTSKRSRRTLALPRAVAA